MMGRTARIPRCVVEITTEGGPTSELWAQERQIGRPAVQNPGVANFGDIVQVGYLTDPARFSNGTIQLQFGWFFDLG